MKITRNISSLNENLFSMARKSPLDPFFFLRLAGGSEVDRCVIITSQIYWSDGAIDSVISANAFGISWIQKGWMKIDKRFCEGNFRRFVKTVDLRKWLSVCRIDDLKIIFEMFESVWIIFIAWTGYWSVFHWYSVLLLLGFDYSSVYLPYYSSILP
jgi:hypothetical protein